MINYQKNDTIWVHEDDIPLVLYHANQCDPKKCSGRKLAKLGLAKTVKTIRQIPKNAIILNPQAPKALSKEDLPFAKKHGIAVLDCSWKKSEELLFKLQSKGVSSPINFGKPFQLSTAEAFGAALYILGHSEEAELVMSKFKWGPHFLKMNELPLSEYSTAKNSQEVVDIQAEFI
jgi:pre-rRNA-processing protein TSR3